MATKKPNILIIWGDDIGWFTSAPTTTASWGIAPRTSTVLQKKARSSLIGTANKLHRRPCRIHHRAIAHPDGTDKGRLARSKAGLQREDPTIAELLKPLGYVCGQFGKTIWRPRRVPSDRHGFDEFFGNLYHLNAEEEPENEDYPDPKKYPEFAKKFGPRGVLHCFANPDGTQKIEDTGHLTRKRTGTMDEEITAGALGFIERQAKADSPSSAGGIQPRCTSGRI